MGQSLNDGAFIQTGDNVYVDIDSGASTSYYESAIRFRHGSVTRFSIEKDNVANADLYIRRYNSSGVLQDSPLKIAGDTGAMTFGSAGALVFSSASTPASIDITATATRAIRIGTKESASTSIAISTGAVLDAEPANNYLLGLFAKVAASEATSTDELRGAWIRTRVNSGCTIGTATGWGYGVCGAEIQLKIYGATINSWQASALWAQLESQDATTTFADGCIASCVLANVGLTATTTIASGGVACGVCINSNTAASGVTATGGFYGLYITQKTAGLLDFTSGIYGDNTAYTTAFTTAGTFASASGRAGKLCGTVNNANYGDGYAFVESELTLTGTCAGHVAAFGSWINIITGTTGAYMVCAQTNGVYEEATGTLTNTTVIFGMRMQSLLAEAPNESFPFSCVSNTNIITALFSCNAGSSDMGTVADVGADTGKVVPLYKETSTGTTYYVRLYAHS